MDTTMNSASAKSNVKVASVRSADGTAIGYRQVGRGPGLVAAVGRDEQKTRYRVNSVVEALPPLGHKIRRNRYTAYRLDLKPRVQVNEILRSGSRVGQHPKIVADRK